MPVDLISNDGDLVLFGHSQDVLEMSGGIVAPTWITGVGEEDGACACITLPVKHLDVDLPIIPLDAIIVPYLGPEVGQERRILGEARLGQEDIGRVEGREGGNQDGEYHVERLTDAVSQDDTAWIISYPVPTCVIVGDGVAGRECAYTWHIAVRPSARDRIGNRGNGGGRRWMKRIVSGITQTEVDESIARRRRSSSDRR